MKRALAPILSIMLAQGAWAAPPSTLADLIGARGSSADGVLNARGYSQVGNTSYWWSSGEKTCVNYRVGNGRVTNLDTVDKASCNQGGSSNDAAAAAIVGVAAIGLAAALASHHKKNDHTTPTHDSEYQRGYNDALYGNHYDNNDSEGYHSGYMDGEAQRNTQRATNSSYMRGDASAPVGAKQACAARGDQYLGMPAGTSVPVNSLNLGNGAYEITVAAGNYKARCTVSASGAVREMNPY